MASTSGTGVRKVMVYMYVVERLQRRSSIQGQRTQGQGQGAVASAREFLKGSVVVKGKICKILLTLSNSTPFWGMRVQT